MIETLRLLWELGGYLVIILGFIFMLGWNSFRVVSLLKTLTASVDSLKGDGREASKVSTNRHKQIAKILDSVVETLDNLEKKIPTTQSVVEAKKLVENYRDNLIAME
jgi:hypothetical protein